MTHISLGTLEHQCSEVGREKDSVAIFPIFFIFQFHINDDRLSPVVLFTQLSSQNHGG